jgi:AraC-like DNA-binding protein
VLAKTHLRGRVLRRHSHSDAQLLYAVQGVMQVQTDQGQWTVPPQRALWLPPGVAHSVLMLSEVEMRTVYFLPHAVSHIGRETRALDTTVLLRELILLLFRAKQVAALKACACTLLLQLIPITQVLPRYLALPKSPALLSVAQSVMANRLWDSAVAEIADTAHMTERSFTRHFSAEVGMSFRTWRQRARVIASLDHVVMGEPLKAVAALAGFQSASAFSEAFKHVIGCTPAQFAAEPQNEGYKNVAAE